MKRGYVFTGLLVAMLLVIGCAVVNPTPPQAGKLEVISHNMSKDDSGRVGVSVTVKNVGSTTVEFAQVKVNFTNAQGNLIDSSSDGVMNLRPGESWNFRIGCSEVGCDQVRDYEIETMAATGSGIR